MILTFYFFNISIFKSQLLSVSGVKALASVVVGVLKPKVDVRKYFNNVDSKQKLDEVAVKRFLLEVCEFDHITHTVKSSSLRPQSSKILPTTPTARAAAEAMSKTSGSHAATPADHAEYTKVFKQHYDTLVNFLLFSSIMIVNNDGIIYELFSIF